MCSFLSETELTRFLIEVLHIHDDVKCIHESCEKKVDFLSKINLAFHEFLPFQNILHVAVNPLLRNALSAQQIKEDMLSGKGGERFLKLFIKTADRMYNNDEIELIIFLLHCLSILLCSLFHVIRIFNLC